MMNAASPLTQGWRDLAEDARAWGGKGHAQDWALRSPLRLSFASHAHAGWASPRYLAGRRFEYSKFKIQNSKFIIHHSSFISHHSSFIRHHSSFIPPPRPLTSLHSVQAVWALPVIKVRDLSHCFAPLR
jgi:hypothetical protein